MRGHISLFAAVLLIGCGGGGEPSSNTALDVDDEDQIADQTMGDDDLEGDDMDQPDTAPSGPVTVRVTAAVGSDEVAAAIQLINAEGDTAAEGQAGQTFTVPGGNYTVRASVTDAAVLADTPTTEEEAFLEPGEPRTVGVRFAVARVRLNVRVRGRALRNPQVELFREGGDTPVATVRATNEHFAITPGRYTAKVTQSGTEYEVRGLAFMDGATQDIPVNIQ